MYYFDKTLCGKAFELLKKTNELADIENDVHQIKNMLDYSSYFTSSQMIELDRYIKDKYPEISIFQKLADSVKWKKSKNSTYTQNTSFEIEMLKFDCYYLLALALKRSGEIVELSDFFDKAYIYNT